jgi:photosystem II stability/assembly factor-like uncharacterized protein
MLQWRLTALVLFLLGGGTGTAAPSWEPIGPPGGDVRSLAADPRNPRVIYLGTAHGVLFRSEDEGGTWRRLSPGFPDRGMSLDDLVVTGDGTLFVGYWEVDGPGGGVARSDDGGRSFSLLPGLQGQGVRALALAPSDPRVLVAGTLGGVFRSEDAGSSWRRISPEGHIEIRNVNSVAIDPRDSRVTYAGTWHLPWKTIDAGAVWRPVKVGMIDDSDVMTLNLDQTDPDTVFATACSGIYRSRNAAGLWSRMRGIPSSSRRTRAFAQEKARPERLYAGTTEGLWRSEDGGGSWRLLTRTDLVVNAVLLLEGGRVLLGTDGAGVLHSADDGRTFTVSNEGFSSRYVSAVALDPGTGRVFAAIGHDRRHGGVFTATRTGRDWSSLGTGLEGREVLSLVVAGEGEDQVVLAGTDNGIFLYASHCGSWSRLPTVVDGLEVHPRVVHVAAASPQVIAAASPRGLLLSRNGGTTWERVILGLAADVTGVAFSSRHPAILAAATPLGLFWSDDLGRSFVQVSNGVAGAPVRGLAFLPADPRVLFATTTAGLLRSPDSGQSFSRYGGGLPLSDITGLAFGGDGRTVFASDFQSGGVYRSVDGGESFSPLDEDGLGGDRVWALAVDPGGAGRILAATAGSGLRELHATTAPSSDLAGSR